MPSLSITYSMECTSQLEDAGEFASVYKGEVFSFDHHSDEEVKVGCVQFTLINVYHAIDEWGDIHEALDLEARLYYYSCLFSDHNEFSDCITDAGMDLEELQVLIVDHICLKEEFRGLGVTQQIISDAERRFAHNRGLTVLMCVPLQFTNFTDDPYRGHTTIRKMYYKDFLPMSMGALNAITMKIKMQYYKRSYWNILFRTKMKDARKNLIR